MEYYLRQLQVLDRGTMESTHNCLKRDTEFFMIFDSHTGELDSYYARRNGKSHLRVDLRENKVLQLCTQKTWEF